MFAVILTLYDVYAVIFVTCRVPKSIWYEPNAVLHLAKVEARSTQKRARPFLATGMLLDQIKQVIILWNPQKLGLRCNLILIKVNDSTKISS